MTRFPHVSTRPSFLALAGGVPATLLVASPSASYTKPSKRKRVLVVTLTKGFRHDSIPIAQQTLWQLSEKQGWGVDLAMPTKMSPKRSRPKD